MDLPGGPLSAGEAATAGFAVSFLPEMETALLGRVAVPAAEGLETEPAAGNSLAAAAVNHRGKSRASIWAALSFGQASHSPSAIQLARGRAALARLVSVPVTVSDVTAAQTQAAEPVPAETDAKAACPDPGSPDCPGDSAVGDRGELDDDAGNASPLILMGGETPATEAAALRLTFPWSSLGVEAQSPAVAETAATTDSDVETGDEALAEPGLPPLPAAFQRVEFTSRWQMADGRTAPEIDSAKAPDAVDLSWDSAMQPQIEREAGAGLSEPARDDLAGVPHFGRDNQVQFAVAAAGTSSQRQAHSGHGGGDIIGSPGLSAGLAAEGPEAAPRVFEAAIRPEAAASNVAGYTPASPDTMPPAAGSAPLAQAARPVPGQTLPGRSKFSTGSEVEERSPESGSAAGESGAEVTVEQSLAAAIKPVAAAARTESETVRHPATESAWAVTVGDRASEIPGGADAGTASTEQTAKTQAPAADLDRPEAAPPLREVSLQVEDASGAAVHLKFTERRGEIHLVTRTADAELSRELAQGLPELRQGIEDAGMSADLWTQSVETQAVQERVRPETQEESASGRGPGHQTGQQGQQESRSGRNAARWMDVIEDSLDEGNRGGI